MIGHSAHIERYKKGSDVWTWRPLRLEGQNRIAVYCGAHLVTLLSAHEVDAAWALVTMRNLETSVIGAVNSLKLVLRSNLFTESRADFPPDPRYASLLHLPNFRRQRVNLTPRVA